MKDARDLVHGWIAKADSDLTTVHRLMDGAGPYDTACFHAQQAIEKLLKAFLAFQGEQIPYTHDLEELQRLALALQPLPDLASLDLFEATDYAVSARYDLQFWPDQDTAAEVLILAKQVRRIVLAALPEEYRP